MKQPQTSQQWWDSIKHDEALIIEWLKDQYHGEATAATRIKDFAAKYADDEITGEAKYVLATIAQQEETHAGWISNLLHDRNIEAELLNKDERYWDKTLPDIESWETGCAVAAQAEAMRLERIKVICNDKDTPHDIRHVFNKILPQEIFHERAFRHFTTPEALAKTSVNQVKGLEALGLVL